jgi:DNA repair photolyase
MRSIQSKTILNKTKRRDPWFLDDYTLNPYSGCSFNCLYCYIRGSKYGEHMEQRLVYKENAVALLEKQLSLRSRKNQYGIIVMSSATDPYLQWEGELGLTRKLLEVILHFRFPLHIITKSSLVERDFGLLKQIDRQAILPSDLDGRLFHKVFITFSFSTLNPTTARIFEPGATPPEERLAALRKSIEAGFHAGVSLMPLLPIIGDSQEQLNNLYATFSAVHAKYLFPASLTLFGNAPFDSLALTQKAVQQHFPDQYEAFKNLFRNFQVSREYQKALQKRIDIARKLYPISESII